MLRVALIENPGRTICMPFGYEVVVPMSFGPVADERQMVNFSKPREDLPATRKEYWLSWEDESMRATIMDEAAAIHYFGHPQARSRDDAAVKDGRLPEYNQERARVARVWGDYMYSDRHGHYSTIRIRVPQMPKVSIVAISPNGTAISDAPVHRPHEFLRFEELLSADAEAELAALAERRPRYFAAPGAGFDLDHLTPVQIEKLAEQLAKFSTTNGSKRGQDALREQREPVKPNG